MPWYMCYTSSLHPLRYRHIPGYRILIHPLFLVSAVLPRLSRYFNIGEQYLWRYKHDLFKQYNSDVISLVSFFPQSRTVIVCNPEAIKVIVADRKTFAKPLGLYGPLAIYGPNVGVSEGSEYIRHRKIVASSNLLENIDQLAFTHTMRTLDSCFEDWAYKLQKTGERHVKIENVADLMLKMALFVILGAAFSHVPAWDDNSPEARPGSHEISFTEAMHGVLKNVWWRLALPKVILDALT